MSLHLFFDVIQSGDETNQVTGDDRGKASSSENEQLKIRFIFKMKPSPTDGAEAKLSIIIILRKWNSISKVPRSQSFFDIILKFIWWPV